MIVNQGERVKYGYGIAWTNYESRSYTAFPVPFNFLFRWLRSVWYFLAKPKKTLQDIAYNDGYNRGYENGKEYGYKKCWKDVIQLYNNDIEGLSKAREVLK